MTSVSFSISGEFITDHARQLWQEHRFAKAYNVLECLIGTTRQMHDDVLQGRARFAGVNDLTLEPPYPNNPPPAPTSMPDSPTPSLPVSKSPRLKRAKRRGRPKKPKSAHAVTLTLTLPNAAFRSHLKRLAKQSGHKTVSQMIVTAFPLNPHTA